MQLKLYHDEPSSAPLAARFKQEQVLAKMQALDSRARRHGLAGLDARRNELMGLGMETRRDGRVTKNGYGVFHLAWMARQHPEWSQAVELELEAIRQGLQAAHHTTPRFLIWAGMGGSAEDKSMYQALGLLRRGPRVYVLDSTDPAKLKAIIQDMRRRSGGSLAKALRATLVFGMAMGMTSYEPVVNLTALAQLYTRQGVDSAANFYYMTLPGSLLDKFASARGYRRIALQPDGGDTTAGRHSGPLTRGSTYPLGLAGVDLAAWMAGTNLREDEIQTAFALAAFLEQQGRAGRDKVTLLLPKALDGLAPWTKQNFEESLGKSEEIGIKIVIGEKVRLADYAAPQDPRQDRVFLALQRHGGETPDKAKLDLLRRRYPTAVLTLPKEAPWSNYMQFIHYAVFGLAWLRRMNFVTQPGVELYKSIANPLYTEAQEKGGIEKTAAWRSFENGERQTRWRGGLTVHWDALPRDCAVEGADASEQYARLLMQIASTRAAEYGELTFFGDTRYSEPGRKLRNVLDKAGQTVFRSGLRWPVDIYEGPAMNHSYHEMIIGHGKCFSTVVLARAAETWAEAGYSPDYHRAQFLATRTALEQRGRLVTAITIKDREEPSRRVLDEFFRAVAKQLRTLLR